MFLFSFLLLLRHPAPMRQQPTTRTTTIRPRTTTNESWRLVGEFLWVSPPTAGPIDLPPPPTSHCDSLVGFSSPNEFPHHHTLPPCSQIKVQNSPTFRNRVGKTKKGSPATLFLF